MGTPEERNSNLPIRIFLKATLQQGFFFLNLAKLRTRFCEQTKFVKKLVFLLFQFVSWGRCGSADTLRVWKYSAHNFPSEYSIIYSQISIVTSQFSCKNRPHWKHSEFQTRSHCYTAVVSSSLQLLGEITAAFPGSVSRRTFFIKNCMKNEEHTPPEHFSVNATGTALQI